MSGNTVTAIRAPRWRRSHAFPVADGRYAALGAIAEGRKGGVIAWLLITVALPLIFLLGLGWHDRFWIWLMPLISLHGVSLALGVGRRQTEVAACE